jgi:hypothetical protein
MSEIPMPTQEQITIAHAIDNTPISPTYAYLHALAQAVAAHGSPVSSTKPPPAWRWLQVVFQERVGDPWQRKGRFDNVLRLFNANVPPQEVLKYFDEIALEVRSPAALAQLNDFLFTFASGPNKVHAVGRAVEFLLRTADCYIATHEWCSDIKDSLARAANIALSIGAPDLIKKVRMAFEDLASRKGTDHQHHRWYLDLAEVIARAASSKRIDLSSAIAALQIGLEETLQYFRSEKKQPLIEGALRTLIQLADLQGGKAAAEPWWRELLKEQETYAEWRKSGSDKPSALVAAVLLESALETANHLCALYGTTEDRKKLEAIQMRIVDVTRDAAAEMKEVRIEQELDRRPFDAIVQHILEEPSPEKRLERLVLESYLPEPEHIRRTAQNAFEQSVFDRLASHVVIEDDRPVAHPSGQAMAEHRANQIAWQGIQLHLQLVFQPALQQLFNEGLLEALHLTTAFGERRLIGPERLPLFEEALHNLLEGRFASALHLLIPQVEDSLRWLLHASGLSVAGARGGIFHLRPIDELLKQAQDAGALPENLILLLRLVLTQEGGNLRHRMAHGILRADECREEAVYLTLYCLSQFLRWKIVEAPAAPDSAREP